MSLLKEGVHTVYNIESGRTFGIGGTSSVFRPQAAATRPARPANLYDMQKPYLKQYTVNDIL